MVVLCQERIVPLTLMSARAIGLMTMIDAGKEDHKIIAVATGNHRSSPLIRRQANYRHAGDDATVLPGLQAIERQAGGGR